MDAGREVDQEVDVGPIRTSARARRSGLRFVEDESIHEYRDVTPLGWGAQFHDRSWVNRAAMELIAQRGGRH